MPPKTLDIGLYCSASASGAISPDLHRPQFWDDNFFSSFFVVASCKSNTQLGCFWWKNWTSSLKTLFPPFVLTFEKLMSRHDTFEVYMIECWWTKKNASSHPHFITDNKKPSFSNVGQHLSTPEVFLKSVPFLQMHHGRTPQLYWW